MKGQFSGTIYIVMSRRELCALTAWRRTSLFVSMQTPHSSLWSPICLLAFPMSKLTPNQFGTSKICHHEIFVFSNDCTHKASPSLFLPPSLCLGLLFLNNYQKAATQGQHRFQTHGDRDLIHWTKSERKEELRRNIYRRMRKTMTNRNWIPLSFPSHWTFKPKTSAVPAPDAGRWPICHLQGQNSTATLEFKGKSL